MAPGVKVIPHNETELQDQKAAELASAVWMHGKAKYNLKEKIADHAEDYVDLGETFCLIQWDKSKGDLIGYSQAVEKETGSPIYVDEAGADTIYAETVDPITGQVISHQPKADMDSPVFSGDFVFKNILPFNVLRCPKAETMSESPYLIVRSMMSTNDLKEMYESDPEKLGFIEESSQTTFKVFDGAKGEYVDGKDQTMVREFFFRPCMQYPKGYYYMTTSTGILEESELPFGVWPIAWCGFQKIQTTPRACSIIRHLRPYQAEVNRAASSQAQQQLESGFDKVFVQGGTKVTKGIDLPGTRFFNISGATPQVVPGRSGEQFMAYLQMTIEEMYRVADLEQDDAEINGQLDPNVLLFRSMRQRKKVAIYAERFESFVKDICRIYLKLAQHYLDESALIRAVGRREAINIAEFKNITDQDFAITLEYVGKDIPPEVRGQIIANMPFANNDGAFGDLTIDYRSAQSDILALDRGEYRPVRIYENHKYMIKQLTNRMKQRDFDLLSPQIKQMYEQKIMEHSKAEAEELSKMKALQSEFIPSGGALAKADLYIAKENGKTERATFPTEALMWLKERLDAQGSTQEQMEGIPPDAIGQIQEQMGGMMPPGEQAPQMPEGY